MEKIGPIKSQPEAYNSCLGCKFHNNTMLKSGIHPVYAHYCTNFVNLQDEKLNPGPLSHTPKGKYIGTDDKTPNWCPALNLPQHSENLQSQVERLALFILSECPGYPKNNEGAIDTAISIIKDLKPAKKLMESKHTAGIHYVVLEASDGDFVVWPRQKYDKTISNSLLNEIPFNWEIVAEFIYLDKQISL